VAHQISHWDPFYRHQIEHLIHWSNRIADEGLYGYVPAFEPGFGSGSYYWDQIPLPVNQLPYTLTGLTYRELTWDPSTTLDQLKERIHRRFFSANAPKELVEDMIYLQKFSFDHAETLSFYAKDRLGYSGETIPHWTVRGEVDRVMAITDAGQKETQTRGLRKKLEELASLADHLGRMEKIDNKIAQAKADATPKTVEGLALLSKMIADTRELYRKAVPDQTALAAALNKLK
jgi:hypothetical protein